MKFGGTSVGSVNGILSVKKIVEAQQEPVIVVVSALSGITDQLYTTARMASEGNTEYTLEYQTMLARHTEIIEKEAVLNEKIKIQLAKVGIEL